MRVTVIGGTGHIGTWMVPQLVAQGHEVVVLSRGRSRPYAEDPAWASVEMITADREAEEAASRFGAVVAEREPEVIMDLTCFTVDSARQLVEALVRRSSGRDETRRPHLIHTGSIWAWGRSVVVPTTEASLKHPYGEYGIAKAAIEDYLLRGQDVVAATVIHPGHITGPGWVPINPAGNGDPAVYAELVRHGRALLPDLGTGLLQHVHAEDVAALHVAAMNHPDASRGEAFNSVAEESMSLRGYAELVARQYGHEPDLKFLPWAEFADQVGEQHAATTLDHIGRSPHHSTAKAADRLGFRPEHTAWATTREAIGWLVDHDQLP